jgi:hypothetical protein
MPAIETGVGRPNGPIDARTSRVVPDQGERRRRHAERGLAIISFAPDGKISAAVQNGSFQQIAIPETPDVGFSVVRQIITSSEAPIGAAVIVGARGNLPRLVRELADTSSIQAFTIDGVADDPTMTTRSLATRLAEKFNPDGSRKETTQDTPEDKHPLRAITTQDIIEAQTAPPQYTLNSIIHDAETHQIVMGAKTGTSVSLETAVDRVLRNRDRVADQQKTPSNLIADGQQHELPRKETDDSIEKAAAGVPAFLDPEALLNMVDQELTVTKEAPKKAPEMAEVAQAKDEIISTVKKKAPKKAAIQAPEIAEVAQVKEEIEERVETGNKYAAQYEGAKRLILIELKYRRRLEAEAVEKLKQDIIQWDWEDPRPPRDTDYGSITPPIDNQRAAIELAATEARG